MGEFKRLAAAVVLSIALHGGLGAGIATRTRFSEKPGTRMAKKVQHEPLIKNNAGEAEALKKERREYVVGLLSALRKGDDIRLSQFLIKSQVLDRNIAMAEEGQSGVSLEDMQGHYLKLVETANARLVNGSKDQLQALYDFVQDKAFTGYFWGSSSVLDIIDSGWHNCLSSAQFLSALMEDVLGRKDYRVLLFDDHVALLAGGKRFEVQADNWAGANLAYDGCGLVAPRDIFIAGYLVKNGVDPARFPRNLASLYNVTISRKGCPESGKDIGDIELSGESSGVKLPSPGVKSGLSVPSYFVPNPRHKSNAKQIVDTARVLFAAYKVSHMESGEIASIAQGGSAQGVSLGFTPLELPADANWGEVIERYKADLASDILFRFTRPKRIIDCNIRHGISLKTISEMINVLPPAAMRKNSYYTKGSICKRYGEVARNGTSEELAGYTPFSFCHELNSVLKARYMAERDSFIVTFGMGTMALPENFDFFADELKSGRIEYNHIAFPMALSNMEKSCDMVAGLKTITAIPYSLNLKCGRPDLAWKSIQKSLSEPSHSPSAWQLSLLDASIITKEQYSVLKSIRNDDDPKISLQLGRIIYDYGEKEDALGRVRETVQTILAAAEKSRYLDLCGYPKEFYPILEPLMAVNPYVTVTIAQGLINSGMVKPVGEAGLAAQEATAVGNRISIRKLRDALHDIVYDEEVDFERRVDAAFLLLRLNIDPLGND
ncbi:hypothetical protein H0O00_04715 [Candidatus Micrarchaeota archaeon]|nr:hypothetical protein [Candidatus Micrarchaeota archaeon]